MKYINIKTGAVFDSPVPVSGENIKRYEAADDRETKTTVQETKDTEDSRINADEIPEELSPLSVSQLKQLAINSNIDLGGATKKRDIINKILQAEPEMN